MMNIDDIHFFSSKKKSQFKLKAQIGPFIVNTRALGTSTTTNVTVDTHSSDTPT